MKNASQHNISTLVALGASLAAFPAAAIELGELTVHSNLGQPLRASIAYALAPNEQLSSFCVSLAPAASGSGLPGIGRATASVANGVIKLTGDSAIREPMVSTQVTVRCPYAANIRREYMMFIDPQVPYRQVPADQPATVVAQAEPTPAAVTSIAVPVRETTVRETNRAVVKKDINAATRYQVQPGDALSTIAQRIENRGVNLWAAVDSIFAANPDSFMDADPNQLKAGSWLTIPNFDGQEAVVTTNDLLPASTALEEDPFVEPQVDELQVAELQVAEPQVVEPQVAEPQVVEPQVVEPQVAEPQVVEPPPVAPAVTEVVIIPDSKLAGPTTVSTSPNVATAAVAPDTAAPASTPKSDSSPWWMWLAGSSIAALFALLFGRWMRNRTGAVSTAAAMPAAHPARRATDTDPENLAVFDFDFDLTDESPTDENLILDADLVLGTGLESAATDSDTVDVMRTGTGEHSILDGEIMPQDDEYDMSVIIDATKMPRPEDATERDLRAVVADTDDETFITDHYTIDKEVDFQVLEQDYEDEMTATQALNEEITRAAAELAAQTDSVTDNDATTALPLASVTELDVTSQLPVQDHDIGDDEDTGINELLTENMLAEDNTVAMPGADNDEQTVEMQLESGKAG